MSSCIKEIGCFLGSLLDCSFIGSGWLSGAFCTAVVRRCLTDGVVYVWFLALLLSHHQTSIVSGS